MLLQAKVLVIGAGGLGCASLTYLVSAGLGQVGLVDGDTISLSNLHRQSLFTTADIGQLKVQVAALRLSQINPEIDIKAYPFYISQNNILALFHEYEYILDGTDNFETRYLINDAAAMLNKPLIFAAVSGYEGQLAIFNVKTEEGQKTNYRDLFPIPPQSGEIPDCATNGVLGVLPGIIGTMQAAETIKLITGIGSPLTNKILHYNLLTQQFYQISIPPASPSESRIPEHETDFLKIKYNNTLEKHHQVIEIDIKELENIRKSPSTIVIDVREKEEWPILNPIEYIQVPLSAFESFMNEEIVQENIILLCQHGIRSLKIAEHLHEKYGSSKNIYSLKGGIVRWQSFFINAE
eukprot:gene21245-25520_t